MNKAETVTLIKSIMKDVDRLTELTKQLQANMDNASLIKTKGITYKMILDKDNAE